jgi:glucokinase
MINDKIKSRVIGINVDVKTTTVAVVDLRGNIVDQKSISTTDYPNVNNFVEVLAECVITLAEQNGGYENIRSVGMCAPSSNHLTGCIENASNMPWKGIIPIAAMLRDSIGLAVALGNDAHVTALGEWAFGLAHGMDNFIVVTLVGSGLGSCFFSNGRAHLGCGGFAGEFGHTYAVNNGRLCTCGRKGCLEEYVSTRGIVKTAKELLEENNTSSTMRQLTELTVENIAHCTVEGDELAKQVWLRTGHILGRSLANYASVINPEAIILTGELTKYSDLMRTAMEESFLENVFGNIRDKVKIVTSSIDDHERNVLGASALAWKVKEYSLFK